MFVVTVRFRAKVECVGQFHEAILFQAERSRTDEPGCLQFDVCVDPQDPTLFFVYEIYQNEAAFHVHRDSPHSAITRERVADLLDERDLTTWQKVDG